MHHIHGCTGMGKERIYKYINNKLAETEFRLIYSKRIYKYINNKLAETEFRLIYSKIRENEIFNGYIGLYHPLREIKEKHDEQ